MKEWIRCIVVTLKKGAWAPLVVLLVHEVFVHICGNLYDVYPVLDIPMHFVGGISISFCGLVFLRQMEKNGFLFIRSGIVYALFIITFTVAAATFWEYAEWFSDHNFGTFSQKGLDDTLFDTVVGLSGGVMFILIFQGKLREGK